MSLHASYLHVHWAGHPQHAQRFADAVHAFKDHDPLLHHGDVEATPDMLDFAVNVFVGERPAWLHTALHEAVDASESYPDAKGARSALARLHARPPADVLPTSGAAEAFTLIAQMRDWRRPLVVHPQFTEPHAALERAGRNVTSVLTRAASGFALDPDAIPEDADLVVVGNPTNPTGVLHPADTIVTLLRPGRLVVVDEAFMDAVGNEDESLAGAHHDGLVVIRSLTKHWSMPGIRAGYVVGSSDVVAALAAGQTPWSVSTPALAAMIACAEPAAVEEGRRRAEVIGQWRDHLQDGLTARQVEFVPSAGSFVLARAGEGVHRALRDRGIAVRRADTFPGLDSSWVRIAVREFAMTDQLLIALDRVR